MGVDHRENPRLWVDLVKARGICQVGVRVSDLAGSEGAKEVYLAGFVEDCFVTSLVGVKVLCFVGF